MTLNEREFEELYRATAPRVLAFLRRRLTPGDAEDVLAETFLVAWRRRAAVPAGEARIGWIFATARRLALAAQRNRRHTAQLRLIDEVVADAPSTGPDSSVRRDKIAARVSAALSTLAPVDQELIALTVWDGLTPTQAATAVGLSGANARVRLHRARNRLAHQLDCDDDGHGAPACAGELMPVHPVAPLSR